MIRYLKGIISNRGDRSITLIVNETIGYLVFVTAQVLEKASPGSEFELNIYTNVREDAIELYGFESLDELDFFERLIGISGVGPKSALGVLSVASLIDIKKAVIHGDPALLQKVSNIGKKTAERIIVELKEKISVSESEDTGVSVIENVQLIDALSSLGYKEGEIRRALTQIPTEAKDLSEKIKEALKVLSKHI